MTLLVICTPLSLSFVGQLRKGTQAPGDIFVGTACLLLPIVLLVASLLLVPAAIMWLRARSQARLQVEATYVFDDQHVFMKSVNQEFKVDWGTFRKAAKTPEMYLLNHNVQYSAWIFIPRRAFESAEQEEAFRELIGRKLGFKGKGVLRQ
jgi:hypothetical protein